MKKSLQSILYGKSWSDIVTDFTTHLENALSGDSLSSDSISVNVQNFRIQAEVNSFILTWENPKTDSFSHVQIRMNKGNTADLAKVFSGSELIYSGIAETHTHNIPVEPLTQSSAPYYYFWIRAFAGAPLPTKGLETWQTIG